MRNTHKVRRLASALVFVLATSTLVLVSSLAAFGQATTGTLRGTITDPNGGVVAGATVTAKNQSTGNSSPTTTNGEGGYVLSNLSPGQYTVTVEATSGFSKKVITDVNVPIGTTTDLPIALVVGAPTEVVTVTSTGEEVITRDQAQISTTFETRKIEDLPSNGAGGGIDTLALLAPGVVASRNSGVNTDGAGLSVNGNRGRSNNFQIDGSDNNDLSIGGPSLFVDNTSQVAEYQVITNNFSAQYGRNSGAVVNIVTKQGGNDFHGDLTWFHRDQYNLNSLTNVERRNGQLKPSRDLYNQFGGTAGGPIWAPKFGEGGKSLWKGKDRAFFFFSYQGIREPSTFIARGAGLAFLSSEFPRLSAAFPGNTAITDITLLSPFAAPHGNVRVRTDAAQVGSGGGAVPSKFFFGSLPTGCTTRVLAVTGTPPAACAAVAYTTFINPATGAPFITGGSYDVVNLGTAAAPNLFQAGFAERDYSAPFTENEWSYRLTFKVTDKDNVDFRHLYQKQLFVNNGGGSNGFSYDVPATSKNLGGTWTRQIGNSMVNEFKATTQNLAVEFGGADSSFGAFAIPAPANIGATIANITFGGNLVGVKNTSTALATIGGATNIPQGRIVTVYQFADTLNWARGKHNFVMGAEYKHLINKVPFLPLYQGQFTFSTTAAVTRLTNNAPSAVSLTAGEPVTTYTENDQYYFFQDDFKIRPNVTLNLGVRYEYTGQPINQLHDITVARESNAAKAIFDPTLPLSIRTIPFVPVDKNNFAPRVGFAYTPHWGKKLFGEDATVIRGGFAIAYDPAFYNILLNLQNVAPYSAALALSSANALASTTTSPLGLPLNPTGDHNQAVASASGVLPLGKLDPRYLSQTQVAPNFHSPYSEQFSFGLQRQVNSSNVFEVRYVGTQGVGLFQNVNANFFIRPLVQGVDLTAALGPNYVFPSFSNLLPPGTTFQTCTNLAATPFVDESTCNGRQKPTAGVTVRDNGAHSTYHSMQTRYSGRFLKNNLSINASYTWSKTIDNASEIFAFADISSPNSQNPFDRGDAERALSNLHRPHAFSATFIYDVPLFKDQRGVLGHLLGGWQFNGVQVSTSGNPFTPNQSSNLSYGLGTAYLTSGDRPFISNPNAPATSVAIAATDAWALFADSPFVDGNSTVFYSVNKHNQGLGWVPVSLSDVRFVINSLGSAKIFKTPFGNMPRNYVHGPGINQLNMSVFKTTKIGERVKLQFQASAFNVLNHPNPGYGVNANGYLPNATLENAGNKQGSAFNDFGDINLSRRVVQFGLRLIY